MSSTLQDMFQTVTAFLHDASVELVGDPPVGGTLVTEFHDFSGQPLPLVPVDGSALQAVDTRTVTSSIQVITDINLWFSLESPAAGGAFNGDYYMRLEHESSFSILLNRTGRRTGPDPDAAFGYGDNGFDIILDDQAPSGDIHTYRLQLPLTPGGPAGLSHDTAVDPTFQSALTGTWSPDGRNVSPFSVSSDDARTHLLSQFNGMPATGNWTLLISDLNAGGTASLRGWGIQVSGHTVVPEPSHMAVVVGLALAVAAALRHSRFRRRP
ncbi:MAG: hypothetical protein AB7O66_09905 [Limisphaerales bacterium]